MTCYYRIFLGKKNIHAEDCFKGNYIGVDFLPYLNLDNKLPEKWQDFNKQYIPVYLRDNSDKTKIGAGLACGFLWTVCRGINISDFVLCPDGLGAFRVGEVVGNYYFAQGQMLPHRRKIRWLEPKFPKALFSKAFLNSAGSVGTVCNVTSYAGELERIIHGTGNPAPIISSDPDIEDPLAFAMEKHLEDFLVVNWDQTDLSKDFLIYEEEGEPVGQQYSTEVGPIDVLAISKDKKRLLVIELKRGKASDVVVGQTLRYMGFVKDQIAEANQSVEGVIIALEDDPKLRWALMAVPGISFYRYQVSFKLMKV